MVTAQTANPLTRLAAHVRAQPILTLAWAALIALAMLAAIDVMVRFPHFDSSVYLYVAEGFLDDELPWQDRWDNKGPLTYLFYVPAVVIGRLALGYVIGTWLLSVAFLVAGAYAAYRLLMPLYGATATLFTVALFLVFYRLVVHGPARPEHFGLPLLFLALLLFVRLHQARGPAALTALAIGALGACCFLTKPSMVGVSLAIGAYWLFTWRDSWRHILFGVAGGLAVLLAAFGAMAALGIFAEFWDVYFTYTPDFVDNTLLNRLKVVRHMEHTFGTLAFVLVAVWCLALYHAVTGKLRGKSYEHLVKLALILAPIQFVIAVWPGSKFGQYYLPLLTAITILLAFCVALAQERRIAPPNVLSISMLVIAVSFLLHGISVRPPYLVYNEYTTVADRELVEYVVAETDEDDTIMVWGAPVHTYYLADRVAPTRFFYSIPLEKHRYPTPAYRNEFLADIFSTPPALIIDSNDDPHSRILQGEELEQAQPHDHPGYGDPSWFRPFYKFVETDYDLVGEISGSLVYRLKAAN